MAKALVMDEGHPSREDMKAGDHCANLEVDKLFLCHRVSYALLLQ